MSDFGALFAGLVDVPTRNGNDISDRAEWIRVNNYYTNALGVLQTTDDFSTENAESETMGPRDDDYRGNETSGEYDDGFIVHGRRDTSVDSVSRDDGSSVRIPSKGSRLYGLRRMTSKLYYEHFGSNKRYVSTVCVPNNTEDITQLIGELRELCGKSMLPLFRLVSIHNGHYVHVVHTCTYLNLSCRCAWLQGVR